MSEPSERKSIKELYLKALQIRDSEERRSYLKSECDGDEELFDKVSRLLNHATETDSFDLDRIAQDLGATATKDPIQPATNVDLRQFPPLDIGAHPMIGNYKLLERLGEGGMGVVYMAEQIQPVRRMVALKIVKPGMDSAQVVARFEAERQAISLMNHPNIATAIDAGTTSEGRPYFVMELVRGVPITQFCDLNRMDLESRLTLFQQVCQAIQHAHQKGIIHRDIKPSNVLVAFYDDHPVPKVIDFGVSKALHQPLTEKTMFTGFGQVVGTIEYMSPEQAKVNQLDIDTRSDIYSLGVLLYELLTGTTPFEKKRLRTAAWDEMLRILREEDPPTPSSRLSTLETIQSVAAARQLEPLALNRKVRGELDWIVMKALEKDRGRRYQSANEFAEDIRRFIADETVIACPQTLSYRLRKLVRSHRALLTTSALVASTLVLGLAGTTWQAYRAYEAKNETDVLLEKEKIARGEAEAMRKLAEKEAASALKQKQTADKRLEQIERGLKLYSELFEGIDPASTTIGNKTFYEQMRERAEMMVSQLQGESIADPAAVAKLQIALAKTLLNLGSDEKAMEITETAIKTNLQIYGEMHRTTFESEYSLIQILHVQGRFPERLERCISLDERSRLVLEPTDSLRLYITQSLAQAHHFAGDFEKGFQLYTEVLELSNVHLGSEAPLTLSTMEEFATAKMDQELFSEALPLLQSVYSTRKRLLVIAMLQH